jgi:ferritin-like metal-binding protein YciE
MPIKTTQEKFMHELGDIYDAENGCVRSQTSVGGQGLALVA